MKAGTTTISYVGSSADCSGDGWYYDVDPFADGGTPTKIDLCPTTCATVRASVAQSVAVVQGCAAVQTADGGPPH